MLEVGELGKDGVEAGDAFPLRPRWVAAMSCVEGGEALVIVFTNAAMAVRAALEIAVMRDDEFTVSGHLDVEFDAQDAAPAEMAKSPQGILRSFTARTTVPDDAHQCDDGALVAVVATLLMT